MSLELYVCLQQARLPTVKAWEEALQAEGFDLTFDDEFALTDHSGFLPVVHNGVDTGFEFYLDPLDDDALPYPEARSAASDCDQVAAFRLGGDERELAAALCASAVLAKMTGGVYYNSTEGLAQRGSASIDAAREMVTLLLTEDGDAEDFESDDGDGATTIVIRTICVAPRLPFKINIRLPFSKDYLQIGQHTLASLRRRVKKHPDNADAYVTLGAHLLSQQPVLPSHADEAVIALETALRLLASKPFSGDTADIACEQQQLAMVHKFLGDALIHLERRHEAREHWEAAIALDPVSPPYGFSGPAQKMLDQYPEQE
jgi:hypothetical protein